MKRTEIFALLRTFLSAVGAYIVGVNVFGVNVDSVLWQEIVGGLMALTGIALSVLDKTITVDQISGFLRQTVTVAGGLGVAYGKLKTEVVVAILAFVPIISAYIKGILDRKKNAGLQSGKINSFDLKK